ncbi:hypothetical protein [Halopiger djelfimassiliensis]|uniref:hypothetical protein n=1 Tax=Halopiger djelfimassiliensis TaxID=1293047 RepID=UPI000677D96A|nr:hypothetical protein [Halopiger djelfimassiliensis]
MRRRTALSLAAVVPLAGCSGLLADDGVDTTIGEDERVEFSASEGAELTVSVTVEEIRQPEDESGLERDSISFRLDHAEEGVIDTWSVSESKTFDLTVDHGGTHVAMVTNGVAHVTIE